MELPEFCLDVVFPDLSVKKVCKKDLLGNWTILYFYPRDNTPGCTIEAKEFSLMIDKFKEIRVTVFGVSRDSIEDHNKFISKYKLKVPLISDKDLILIKSLGAWQKKRRFGKETYGVVRSTFIINEYGKIVWYKYNVRAKGHAEEVYKIVWGLIENENN